MATRALQSRSPGYGEDGFGWANHQAALIRAGRVREIDWENVAEEIESVGKSERSRLESALRVLLIHLLKWDYQPERRGNSWASTIREQRLQYTFVIEDNPSLKSDLPTALDRAYRLAWAAAAGEMNVNAKSLPSACPYDLPTILEADRSFDSDA